MRERTEAVIGTLRGIGEIYVMCMEDMVTSAGVTSWKVTKPRHRSVLSKEA